MPQKKKKIFRQNVKTNLELLQAVQKIFKNPNNWTPHDYGLDENGQIIDINYITDPKIDAYYLSLSGAVYYISQLDNFHVRAMFYLSEMVPVLIKSQKYTQKIFSMYEFNKQFGLSGTRRLLSLAIRAEKDRESIRMNTLPVKRVR